MPTVSQRVDARESHVLYDGKVRLDFDPVKHWYYINGEYANGVTTVLKILNKPALVGWAANMAGDYIKANLVPGEAVDEIKIQALVKGAKSAHRDRRDSAADGGTYIHNWIEEYVRGENPAMPVNPTLKRVIDDFLEWHDRVRPETVYAERMLCSVEHKLAGTPDLVCRVDGKLTIMDWKTGSGIYPEMFLQMAAYAIMYEEEFGEKIEALHVVNASLKNMFRDRVETDVEKYKTAFLQAMNLQRSMKDIEREFSKKG